MKSQTLKGICALAIIGLMWGECSNVFSFPQQNPGKPREKVVAASLATSASSLIGKPISTKTKNSYGQLPIYFEKNQGQTDSRVQFVARGGGYTLFLTPTETVFALRQANTNQIKAPKRGRLDATRVKGMQPKRSAVLRMKLSEANLSPALEGSSQLLVL